ncbi:MAG: hypothetical protein WCO64_08340 [Actinomycetes bacterium]
MKLCRVVVWHLNIVGAARSSECSEAITAQGVAGIGPVTQAASINQE